LTEEILLGFEVNTGEPIRLSLHHLAIFGMTQLSGKTTALEALISRSGLKAVAFITKRGESGFTKYNLVTPYYKPRSDWQFVEGLVNVALGEKVKYEPGMRYAIMKVCRSHKDLKEIQQAAQDLAKDSKREFMKSVYEKLVAYLEIVIPELERWTFSERLTLHEGVNVMDLSGMRLETQHLVIASTVEHVFTNLDHTIVIIPEAWETLPQSKMTPVKWVAQQFIRKGAAIGNYLWLDSQDIGGIDKTPLRQCDNWIMGRMKEAHEVERILKQLLGVKVAAEEIQTLPLGTFYAAIGNQVRKVYVLPAGVPGPVGVEVAQGIRTPESVRDEFLKVRVREDDEKMWREKYEALVAEVEKIRQKALEEGQASISAEILADNKKLQEENVSLKGTIATQKAILEEVKKQLDEAENVKKRVAELEEEDEAVTKLRDALRVLMPTPAAPMSATAPVQLSTDIHVSVAQPALTIKKPQKALDLDASSPLGRLAICYAEGLLSAEWSTSGKFMTGMENRFGAKESPNGVAKALADFVFYGFFEKRMKGTVAEYRLKVAPEEARQKGLLKNWED